MAAAAGPGGRATLDFFDAQANARRRTVVLVVSFGLALLVVIAVVYAALLVVAGAQAASGDYGEYGAALPALQLFQPGLLVAAASGVAAVTGLGGAYHAMRLSAGGGDAVAQMLGGALVSRGSQDPAERRLVNVVEEMAIAAGLPVPRLYVLQGEGGINAFAAGFTPGHGVVAVTRGALDKLGRDELQGVVAHEISHLLNADTRIDLRLMAAVGGLTILSLIGRFVLDNTSWSRSRDGGRARGAFLLVGLALLVAGAFGALCGKLVRYAVARQREWLADAAAVQFTRNPDGLAGALRKIQEEGSAIHSPHAPEAAHLFFASSSAGFLADLLSTHPPLEERIRRLLPGGDHAAVPARQVAAPGVAPRPVAPAAGRAGLAAAATVLPTAVVGPPAPRHLAHASDLLARLAPQLAAAAREPFGARGIACALLLDGAPAIRAAQLDGLGRRDPAARFEVERLAPAVGALARADRTALLGLALPALDALSPAQAEALREDLRALAAADCTITAFEWAVQRIALRRLDRGAGAPAAARIRALDEAQQECLDLLSTLAWIGGREEAPAQQALDAGVAALGVRDRWRLLPSDRIGPERLDSALARLDQATPVVKGRVLAACVATVLADERVTIEEAEILRAVAASLGLPMPPIVPGPVGAAISVT